MTFSAHPFRGINEFSQFFVAFFWQLGSHRRTQTNPRSSNPRAYARANDGRGAFKIGVYEKHDMAAGRPG